MDFANLEDVYRKWLHLEHDPYIVRLLYSVVVANRFAGNPVWAMVVGPSGCGKSELLMSLSGSDEVISVSTMTPQSLASGSGDPSDSLLFDLDQKMLVVEDLSSITELPKDSKGMLFSFLRSAYNGEFVRVTGRGRIEWKGKFGMLGGATPAIEQSRSMEASLGERFINLRSRTGILSERDVMAHARSNTGKRARMKRELQNAASKYLSELKVDPNDRKLKQSTVSVIEESAIALAKSRSGVIRDPYSKDIVFPVDRGELGTRIQGQFILIALASRAMGTDPMFVEEMILRAMLDSIPYVRLRVLDAVVAGANKHKEIAAYVQMSGAYVQRVLEEMRFVGLLKYGHGKDLQIVDDAITDAMRKVR